MNTSIESVTMTALTLALDAAALRQQAIAANVANQATPGYVPVKVDFGAQMQEARRSLEMRGRIDSASLAGVRPSLAPVHAPDGAAQPTTLDEQMADLAENTVRYQALAKGLARQFSILSAAVNDGRR